MTTDSAELRQQLEDALATIQALLGSQVDAVLDPASNTPVLLSQAQKALRESEARYRQIVESTNEGIIQVDAAGTITFANHRIADLLQVTVPDLLGRNAFEVGGPRAGEMALEAWQDRHLDNKQDVELPLTRKDGSTVHVSVAPASTFDENGTFTGALCLIRDVTEQKRLLGQLMISDRMASIGTLAAGVGHEINNPLAVVISSLSHVAAALRVRSHGASAGEKDDGVGAALADAQEAAERVRVIVRDLKMFSRQAEPDALGPVDVQLALETSLRMAANEIRHRARLVTRFGPVPQVDANAGKLGQVFLNLLVNAAQALPDGQMDKNEITVSTRLDGHQVVVDIADTGPGIPAAILDRIFDAFFTTKPVGVGTGLGLAIAHKIVTGFGGQLTVQTRVGKGTTFSVSLPVALPRAAPSIPVTHAPPSRVHGRILAVDDDVMVSRVLARCLGADHDVLSVLSAKEALALCVGGQKFDLILSDLMMPHMTGMDLYRELLVTAPDQAARMVFLTGGAFSKQAQEFLETPGICGIEKPFDQEGLKERVQQLLHGFAAPV